MKVKSKLPGKQRKAIYTSKRHHDHKLMRARLSEELSKRYNIRSTTVRKGDIVEIMRGDAEAIGKSGKVADIDNRHRVLTIDGVTIGKADGTQVARKIHPSNVRILTLGLADEKRREKLEEGKK